MLPVRYLVAPHSGSAARYVLALTLQHLSSSPSRPIAASQLACPATGSRRSYAQSGPSDLQDKRNEVQGGAKPGAASGGQGEAPSGRNNKGPPPVKAPSTSAASPSSHRTPDIDKYARLFAPRRPDTLQARDILRALSKESVPTILAVLRALPQDIDTHTPAGSHAWRVLRLYVSRITLETRWDALPDHALVAQSRGLLALTARFGRRISSREDWKAERLKKHETLLGRARRDETWQGLWAVVFDAAKVLHRRNLLRVARPKDGHARAGEDTQTTTAPAQPGKAAGSREVSTSTTALVDFPVGLADDLFETFVRPSGRRPRSPGEPEDDDESLESETEGASSSKPRAAATKPPPSHDHVEANPVRALTLATTLSMYNELKITPTARQLAIILRVYSRPSFFSGQSDLPRESLLVYPQVAGLLEKARSSWVSRQALAENAERLFNSLSGLEGAAIRQNYSGVLCSTPKTDPDLPTAKQPEGQGPTVSAHTATASSALSASADDPSEMPHSVTPTPSGTLGALTTPMYDHLTEAALVNWQYRDWAARAGHHESLVSPATESDMRRTTGYWAEKEAKAAVEAPQVLERLVQRWNEVVAKYGHGAGRAGGAEPAAPSGTENKGKAKEAVERIIVRPNKTERIVLNRMIKAQLVRSATGPGANKMRGPPGQTGPIEHSIFSRRVGTDGMPGASGAWPRPVDLGDYTVVELLQLLRGLEVVPAPEEGQADKREGHWEMWAAERDGGEPHVMDEAEKVGFESVLFRVRNAMLHEGTFEDLLELVEMLQPDLYDERRAAGLVRRAVAGSQDGAVQTTLPVPDAELQTPAPTLGPRLRLSPIPPVPGALVATLLGTVQGPAQLAAMLARLLTLPVPAEPAGLKKPLRQRLQGLLLQLGEAESASSASSASSSDPALHLDSPSPTPPHLLTDSTSGTDHAAWQSRFDRNRSLVLPVDRPRVKAAQAWLEMHGGPAGPAYFLDPIDPRPEETKELDPISPYVRAAPGASFDPHSGNPKPAGERGTRVHPRRTTPTASRAATPSQLGETPWARVWRAGVERWGFEVIAGDDRHWREAYLGLLRARRFLRAKNHAKESELVDAEGRRKTDFGARGLMSWRSEEVGQLLEAWRNVRRDGLSGKAKVGGWKKKAFKATGSKVGAWGSKKL